MAKPPKIQRWNINKLFSDLRGFFLDPEEGDYIPEYTKGSREKIVSKYKKEIEAVKNVVDGMMVYGNVLEDDGIIHGGTLGTQTASELMSSRYLFVVPSSDVVKMARESLTQKADERKFDSLRATFVDSAAVTKGIEVHPKTGKKVGHIFGMFSYDFIKLMADRAFFGTIDGDMERMAMGDTIGLDEIAKNISKLLSGELDDRLKGEHRLLLGETGVEINGKKYDRIGDYIADNGQNISDSLKKFLLAHSAIVLHEFIGHVVPNDLETLVYDQMRNEYWDGRDANIISDLRINDLDLKQIYKECFEALKELFPEGVWSNTFDSIKLLSDISILHPLLTEVTKRFDEGQRSVDEITRGLARTLVDKYGVKANEHDLNAFLKQMFIVRDKNGEALNEGVLDVDELYKNRNKIKKMLNNINDVARDFEETIKNSEEFDEVFPDKSVKEERYSGEHPNPLLFMSEFSVTVSNAISDGKTFDIPYHEMKNILMEIAKLRQFYTPEGGGGGGGGGDDGNNGKKPKPPKKPPKKKDKKKKKRFEPKEKNKADDYIYDNTRTEPNEDYSIDSDPHTEDQLEESSESIADAAERDADRQDKEYKIRSRGLESGEETSNVNYSLAIANIIDTMKYAILDPTIPGSEPIDVLVNDITELDKYELGSGEHAIYNKDEDIAVIGESKRKIIDDVNTEQIMIAVVDTSGSMDSTTQVGDEGGSTIGSILSLVKSGLVNAACIGEDGKPNNRILVMDWDTTFHGVVGLGGDAANLEKDLNRALESTGGGGTGNFGEILPRLKQIVNDNRKLFAKELKRIGFEGDDDKVVEEFLGKYEKGEVGLVIYTDGYIGPFDEEFVEALHEAKHIDKPFDPTPEDEPSKYGKVVHNLTKNGIAPVSFVVPDEDMNFLLEKPLKKLSKKLYKVIPFNKGIRRLLNKK